MDNESKINLLWFWTNGLDLCVNTTRDADSNTVTDDQYLTVFQYKMNPPQFTLKVWQILTFSYKP